MRTDSANFSQYNTALAKAPRYVVALSFNTANTDVFYITSHASTPVPVGATALQGLLSGISGTTQQINPETGVSVVGAINLSVLDKTQQFSSVVATKLAAGYGLRRKRAVVYVGYDGLTWSDFQIVATQIVDEVSHKGLVVKVSCADVQRTLKDAIFDLQKTNLSASISATAMLIPVYSVTDFALVAHGTSYTDAPSASVGYLRIDDEVIRWTGTITDAVLGLCFVVGQRGALNTYPAAHEVDSGAAQDTRPAVTEMMYLEMPVPKMMLALLTGSLYNQPGQTLPAGWHLGIDSSWVRTADFVNIGADWWDPADDTKGLIFRFVGEKRQEGKKFIESQICRQLGAYVPVYSNGEMGLIRTTSILSDAAHVTVLDEDNCIELPDLRHAMKEVRNIYKIQWNYDWINGEFTRDTLLVDTDSITKHDVNSAQILECRGLHGSRHTQAVLATMFDRMRDRFAGPPVRLSLGLLHHMNRLEVGDVVRVQLYNATDLNTGASIDRSFEVQQVSMDWITGRMKVDLFGSSMKAGVIAASGISAAPVLADSWYSSSGAVALATYPGITTNTVGGVLHITAGSLTGAATIGAAKYYHVGDIQIDGDITIDNNVMLAIAGHVQINAKINGKGAGEAGVVSTAEGWIGSYIPPVQTGTQRGMGATLAGGYVMWGIFQPQPPNYDGTAGHGQFPATIGEPVVPVFTLNNSSGQLIFNSAADLVGCSGGPGGPHVATLAPYTYYLGNPGGNGGNSGAGLCIVSRGGSFGAVGSVDISGNDGLTGNLHPPSTIGSGAGAGGAPGGLLWLLDGDTAIPGISSSTVLCEHGKSPYGEYSGTMELMPKFAGIEPARVNKWQSFTRIQYIPPQETAATDAPIITSTPLAISLNVVRNSPPTPDGSMSTIDVTVTPPSDTNFLYCNIYYATSADGPWIFSGPTLTEWSIPLTADGSTIYVQARSVSINGIENPAGVTASAVLYADSRTAPPTPSNFAAVRTATGVRFNWDFDSTVKFYEIRKGSSWGSSLVIGRPIAPPFDVEVSAATTYLIKAVDLYGVYSIAAASVILEVAADVNVVVNYLESTGGWDGTCTNTTVTAYGIELAAATPIDSLTSPIDSYSLAMWEYSRVVLSGSYESEVIDVGAVLTSRIEIDPVVEQVPLAEVIDQYIEPIDHYTIANGHVIAGPLGLVSASFQIRFSDDNITWSTWRNFIIGNYSGRYLQFTVTLNTEDSVYLARLSELEVTVDVPDREIMFDRESIPSGGKTITFSPAFIIAPTVSVTIQSGAAGDSYRITNKSASSMDIELLDSSLASKAGTVDIRARAY